jgi:hypothetical protein
MDNGMQKMVDRFIVSYMERDRNESFSYWLSGQLQQEMPGMSDDACERLSSEIIASIAQYDQTLSNVGRAMNEGQSQEEWFAGQMSGAYSEMPNDESGDKLRRIYNDMLSSNAGIMGEADIVTADYSEAAEWDEFSLKAKALEIAGQAGTAALGIAANTIRQYREHGDSDSIRLALQEETSSGEVKAAVAGGMKAAAENRLTDALPADTPIEVICDIASVSVEEAEALHDVATGKIGILEALDRIGRAIITATFRGCANVLEGYILRIPTFGPFIAEMATGLLNHMKTPQFTDEVCEVLDNMLMTAWEGIKKVARGIRNFFSNKAENRNLQLQDN